MFYMYRIFMFITVIALVGCSEPEEENNQSDSGSQDSELLNDINNQTNLCTNNQCRNDTVDIGPRYGACEGFTSETECLEAGCSGFADFEVFLVDVDSCNENGFKSICYLNVNRDGPDYIGDIERFYYRYNSALESFEVIKTGNDRGRLDGWLDCNLPSYLGGAMQPCGCK